MSNEPKKPEEMSLAELLGGGSPVEPDQSAPAAAQPDEAGSGMINLAQMVMTANKPKPAPAPTPQPDPFGGQNAWGASPAGSPSQYPTAPAPVAQKKSPVGIIVGIAVAVILITGVVVFLLLSGQKEDASRDAEMAALQAQLALALQKAKASGNEAEIARLQAKVDATAAGQKVEPESMDFSAEEGEEEEEEEVVEGEDGKPRKTGRRIKRTTAKSPTTETSTTSTTADATPAKTEAKPTPSTTTTGTASSTKGNTSELSSLLGGGTKAPAPSSGLPAKPSKEQVAKAMAPVASKSQSTCSQWGTGKVSIRVVVGGNGRVRDAIPQGEHAASPLGRCVSKVAMTASFPPFTDPTLTFSYPITIK